MHHAHIRINTLVQGILAALCCVLVLQAASAQESGQEGITNYAYSVFAGTGRYNIGDRVIYVLRLPMAMDLRKPDYETKTTGFRLLFPAAVGITDFADISDIPELDLNDLQTMTFTPGLEAQFPVKENWLIKPFGQAGLGWDLTSSSNSFVWGLGARTRAWFGDNDRWLIGGELLWAGNNPKYDNEPTTRFSRIAIGAEYKWQTNWQPFGYRVSWHTRLIQWIYTDAFNLEPPIEEVNIDNSTEIGVSFGINPPINIFGYKFRQGGIGYERSDEFRAIKLFTTFPF